MAKIIASNGRIIFLQDNLTTFTSINGDGHDNQSISISKSGRPHIVKVPKKYLGDVSLERFQPNDDVYDENLNSL